MNADPDFGQKMAQLQRERGGWKSGRKPFAEKYGPQVRAAERTFARALPDEAEHYITELQSKAPERCPDCDRIMGCPECGRLSQRQVYDHKAAQYIFDRIMGKPTARTENAMTIKFVEQIQTAFLLVFEEVNAIDDPATRSQTFGQRCLELVAQFNGAAA